MEPDQQNEGGPGTPPAPPQQIDQALDGVHQADPNLLNDLNARLGAPEQPTPDQSTAAAGQKSGLWDRIKKSLSGAGISLDTDESKKEVQAVGRGALKGVDGISNTIVGAAVGISKKTGVYKAGRTQQEQDSFLKWWDQPTSKANPIQFGDDRINKWMGPQQGGLAGFVEGASQFAVGMLGASKLLKAPGVAATVLRGGIADMTAFDPHQKRLSNMIEQGAPSWVSNPVTRFLSSDAKDGDALAYVKSGLEGILTNGTIEAFSYGLKAIKALKAGDAEGAAKAQTQAAKVAETPAPSDVVGIKQTPDGKFAVAPNGNLSLRRKVASIVDPTLENERRSAERAADTNPVSGLPNKRAWQKALPAAEADPNTSVIHFDANGFKNVNDQLGHDTGDEALKHIATTLSNVAEQHGIGGRVFHIGGDEFGVLAPSGKAETIRDAMEKEYGVKTYTNEAKGKTARTSLSGAVGNTSAEADAAVNPRKALHKKEQGIAPRGQVSPIVPEPDPHDPDQIDLFGDAPQFQNRGEAESFAASVNYAHANAQLPDGGLSPEHVDGWKKALDGYRTGKDPRDAAELLDTYGINTKYIQAPEDVVSHLKALVDIMPEPSATSRNRPRTFADVAKDADKMEFAGMSGHDAIEAAHRVFGDTHNLDAKLYAMRTWEWAHGKQVQKLARMAELDPDNPVAHDQLAKALDTMLDFHEYRTGSTSNVARGLNAHKMPVGGEALADGEKAAAKSGVTDAEVQAETNANGTEQTGTVEDAAGKADEAATTELKSAVDDAKGALEEAKKNKTDTISSSAGDFSLARARSRVENALKAISDGPGEKPVHDEALAKERADKINEQAQLQRDNPLEPLSKEQTDAAAANGKGTVNPIEELSKLLDQADAKLKTQEEIAAKRAEAKAKAQVKPEQSPVSDFMATQKARTPGGMEGAQAGPAQTASSNAGAASPMTWKAPVQGSVTDGLTRSQVRALSRTIFMTEGDPGAILKALRGPKGSPPAGVDPKSWIDYVNKYRVEAMLSGPKTLATFAVNNMITMVQRPLEYYWAGVRNNNPELRQQGADILGGLFKNIGESWSAARKSFLQGDNVIDPQGVGNSSMNLPKWGDIGWLSKLANAPSRMIMAEHEFFKQMNYRANLRSQILRQARDQGVTDAGELAQRLNDDMHFAFDPNGGAVNPLALQYARVGTFTNDLGAGTVGSDIQSFVQQHPAARFVLPFVRTPVNIFRYAWERTPGLNRFSSVMKEDLAAGGERAQIAQAKSELGGLAWATSAALVLSGNVTGAGPTDPELRRQWKDVAKHEPYSIKIPGTDRWVSYRRLDPFGSSLGLTADAMQVMTDLSHRGETWEHIPAAVMASVASNAASKTFMTGITEFMDALSAGDGHKVEKLLKGELGSLSPNILRQMNPDDTIRETRGYIDEMLSRVPGFSETLEPKRNLFGEKVLLPPWYANRSMNPFTLSGPPQDTKVADELIKLGRAMTMPAETKESGLIKLTDRDLYDNGNGKRQSPYDRMLELIGNPPDGQPSLKKQLSDLVQSDGWTKLAGDNSIQPGGMKWQLAQNIINANQQAAWGRVLQEYPKLQAALGQSAELKGRALGGGQAAVDSTIQKYQDLFVKPSRGSRK